MLRKGTYTSFISLEDEKRAEKTKILRNSELWINKVQRVLSYVDLLTEKLSHNLKRSKTKVHVSIFSTKFTFSCKYLVISVTL